MTDIEFDIIDELYFVISFNELLENVSLEENELIFHLKNMLNKGWVRCFINIEGEEPDENSQFEKEYMNYYYLASKEGLRIHNSL